MAYLVKKDKAVSWQEQEEEVEKEVTTWSVSLSELWDMQKDFSHHPGERVTPGCSDAGIMGLMVWN